MQLIIWEVIVAYQCMIKGQNKARASINCTKRDDNRDEDNGQLVHNFGPH